VRAEIKWLMSPDIDVDSFVPADPSDVSVALQLIVGPAGEDGEESFGIDVLTPTALARRVRREGPIVGRHLLIVDHWDFGEISAYLHTLVGREQAPTWNELGNRLARVGYWEFEDYRP
jgi:hypothetical protein